MKNKNGGIFSGMDVFSSCRQLRQPSFSGVLEVRHAIKGRIRLSIPSLKRNLVGAENFKRQLTRLQGIETVSVNLFLGTVLITYNPRILNQLLVISASTHCFDFDRQLEQHQSVFGCETKAIRFALDQALLRNTYGILDLRSAMTLMFMVTLIRGIMRQGSVPFNPLHTIWWLFQSVDK